MWGWGLESGIVKQYTQRNANVNAYTSISDSFITIVCLIDENSK